ncbi:MAG: L,D-transpeptidase family protein [Blastocatellia bacterium]
MKLLNLKHASQLILIVIAMGTVATINVNAQQKQARKQKAPAARAITVEDIRQAEQSLSDLGYWTGPIDGRMDESTRSAIIAFQKVEGRTPAGRLTEAELQVIRSATRPSPLETGYAHVEADLGKQVLFVVDENGTVTKVLPISSGSGEEFTSEGWTRRAVTPTGRFKVYRKVEGWRKAPLGSIYYPNYFLSGVAIHGSPSVPTRPASHGCIRIPVFAAKEFSEMTPNGTVVLVHGGSAFAQSKTTASSR